MLEVRMIEVDEWPTWRELRLAALGEAPYAFGSKLADWQGAGDNERRWRDRLAYAAVNLVAEIDGRPAGMASGVRSGDGPAQLISMWVAPFARGRGVGDALVDGVLRWAAAEGLRPVELGVRDGNDHAVALYRRHGFVDDGIIEGAREGEPLERRMVRP